MVATREERTERLAGMQPIRFERRLLQNLENELKKNATTQSASGDVRMLLLLLLLLSTAVTSQHVLYSAAWSAAAADGELHGAADRVCIVLIYGRQRHAKRVIAAAASGVMRTPTRRTELVSARLFLSCIVTHRLSIVADDRTERDRLAITQHTGLLLLLLCARECVVVIARRRLCDLRI